MRGKKEGGGDGGGNYSRTNPELCFRFSLSVENEQAYAGRDGRTRLAAKFSGANGDTGNIHFPS